MGANTGFFGRAVLRLLIKAMKSRFGGTSYVSSEGLSERFDIPYSGRDGCKLALDRYRPAGRSEKLPVVVEVHGGGLICGTKEGARSFCRVLARKGYLVFSLEYPLVPEVTAYEQINDVCAGMDAVDQLIEAEGGDRERVYLTGESAGSFLCVYAACAAKSAALRCALGCAPSNLRFNALALISGMFYTGRKDAVGILMAPFFFGKGKKAKAIGAYRDPESPEIVRNLPPCYLVTSRADMLERHTVDFAGALHANSIAYSLRHAGRDKRLTHAFPVFRPEMPESAAVIAEIDEWFRAHAER